MVLRKPNAWIVPVRVAKAPQDFDSRQYPKQTWRSIVQSALEDCGGSAPLEQIYAAIQPHIRAATADQNGTDWRAIVRRELQEGPFQTVIRGIWGVAVS